MSHDDAMAYVSIAAIAVISFVVLCGRIREGLITKLGLLIVLFACAADVTRWMFGLDSYVGMYHSATAVRAGITLALIGIVIRHWRKKN